ncbi:hypothetical protein THRCLA_05469 [Thraustotheca clavata]|uniref:Uncharacterized protein n=1 Tax=Thraustotheca clavata TaxID=74557 RepID=A0A1V9ZVU2_9STRA|nr:hypothetical protein THRCLA_05469 [Thraustotheca clavata]
MTNKRVRFHRVVSYEFALGLNASAIPLEHGPSIGLVGPALHIRTSKIKKKQTHSFKRSSLRRYDKQQRLQLLQEAGVPMKEIVDFCVEALDIRISRSSSRRKTSKQRSYLVARNTEINENANITYN